VLGRSGGHTALFVPFQAQLFTEGVAVSPVVCWISPMMSMGVMRLKEKEMIDYPGIDYVGVGSFIQMISESKQVVFL
jgi:peroxiredoxin family protein